MLISMWCQGHSAMGYDIVCQKSGHKYDWNDIWPLYYICHSWNGANNRNSCKEEKRKNDILENAYIGKWGEKKRILQVKMYGQKETWKKIEQYK